MAAVNIARNGRVLCFVQKIRQLLAGLVEWIKHVILQMVGTSLEHTANYEVAQKKQTLNLCIFCKRFFMYTLEPSFLLK